MSDFTSSDSVASIGALSGLAPSSFAHPLDRTAAQALKKLKVFDRAVAKLVEWQGERADYVELNATAIRVTPRQLPGLHALLVDSCRVLDMPVPEMFVKEGGKNAYTSGHNNPYVVLETGAVDVLTDAELKAVIAHELGHIKCNHVLNKMMVKVLCDVGVAGAGSARSPWVRHGARVALPRLERQLTKWNQRSELTADRAAMLVVQDEDVCLRMMLKLAGAPARLFQELDPAEFLEQAAHLANLVGESGAGGRKHKDLLASGTHPLPVERARQLHTWVKDGGYAKVVANPGDIAPAVLEPAAAGGTAPRP